MAKYKAYPEYKDSGVEWLGAVPSHWEILSAKRMFQSVRTPAYKSDEQLAASQKYGVIPQSLMMQLNDSKVMLALKGTESFRHVEANNFVISLRSFEGGIEYSQYTGCVSPAYTVLKNSKPISYGYYRYLLKCMPFIAALQSSTDSLRDGKSINYEQFSALSLPLSSVQEQNVIAVFLDHETAKIDNLIEKQQQLIEILKEKRQAVISHAVTKGLNPDVPMKDSGVEWLGEVPKHWKCGYLRWYISVSSGTYLNNKEFETDESNDCMNPVIGGNGVMGFTSKTNDGNCLVVGRVGALCGNVHQIRRSCWVTDNALKITYGCDFDVDYLEMYLKVLDLNKLANHNAQPLITGTMIKEQVAIIPPIDEQKNITKFIQSKVGKIDLLILKSSEAVDKIKERRTALISAAVTGKIDVRDWVAPDTQDVEEPQEATA
ncbi:restriction endonuclease subunit S [Cronobacter muytjensii]